MRFLVISDIHDEWKIFYEIIREEQYDAIFFAGDFTYSKDIKGIISRIGKIRDITKAPMYFVPGNCDPPEILDFERPEDKIYNVHMRSTRLNDITIVGIGGSLITPFDTPIEFNDDEYNDMVQKISKSIIPNKTIILSHMPPLNTLDKIYSGKRIGSITLKNIIIEKKPLAVFVGHVHENRGIVNFGKTIIVNPGPLMLGFYAIIQLEKNKIDTQLKKWASSK